MLRLKKDFFSIADRKGWINMNVIVSKTYEEMCQKAARLIAAQLTLKPDSVLGLATGSTPIGIYQELICKYQEDRLDFSKVTTVNLDEYVGISEDNEQSYRYFMNHNLFDHVNIPKKYTYVPNGSTDRIEEECEDYEQLIEQLGGVDLQLLGIGGNGHIGFNEPCGEFPEYTHLVDLKQETIEANSRFFSSMDEVPKQAVTMGIGTIMQAKKVVLVANGVGKAKAIYDTLFGPVTPNVPASILRFHPDVTVFVDEEAFSMVAQKH